MAGNLYDFKNKTVLSFDTVVKWQTALYSAVGLNNEDAHALADCLATADLRGVYSHGVQRTPNYVRQFQQNELNPKARAEIIRKKGALAVMDGHSASGIVNATRATKLAIEMAREFGTASVSLTGSAHLGACAYYVEMAADADMIGFCWSNGGCNIMVPFGGRERQLGSNPFAIAAPCFSKPNMVLDMATSTVARGKIQVAALTGTDIPPGWAVDKNGRPTTDSREALLGALLPAAGYKGAGLALMNAVITAVLVGATFGPDMPELQDPVGVPQNVAHLIQVIDIAAVDDVDAFKKRMDRVVEYMHGGRAADGYDEILVPGEPEARTRARQLRDGIAYPVEVIERNNAVAATYHVAPLP